MVYKTEFAERCDCTKRVFIWLSLTLKEVESVETFKSPKSLLHSEIQGLKKVSTILQISPQQKFKSSKRELIR